MLKSFGDSVKNEKSGKENLLIFGESNNFAISLLEKLPSAKILALSINRQLSKPCVADIEITASALSIEADGDSSISSHL